MLNKNLFKVYTVFKSVQAFDLKITFSLQSTDFINKILLYKGLPGHYDTATKVKKSPMDKLGI